MFHRERAPYQIATVGYAETHSELDLGQAWVEQAMARPAVQAGMRVP